MSNTNVLFFSLLLGILITFIARYIYSYPLHPTDELNYIAILNYLENKSDWPISGPGYVMLLQGLQTYSQQSYSYLVPTTAMLISSIYYCCLYFLYRLLGLNNKDIMGIILILSLCSYFLAPMLEGRPQQLGMLWSLALVVIFIRMKDKKSLIWLFVSAYVGLLYYHLLSFLIAAFLIWGLVIRQYLSKKNSFNNMKILLFSTLISTVVLFTTSSYHYMLQNICDFHIASLLKQNNIYYLLLGCGILAIILKYLYITLQIKKDDMMQLEEKYYIYSILTASIILSIVAFIFIWYISPTSYLTFYQESIILFFLFQMGNIYFGIGFFYGLYQCLSKTERLLQLEIFFQSSGILMLLGAVVVLLSPFLGDKNWIIRVIDYWTLFAAPLVLSGIKALQKKCSYTCYFFYPALLYGSLLHVIRP